MRHYSFFFFIIVIILCSGCSAPKTPLEIRFAEAQKAALIKAGVREYTPDEYQFYLKAYSNAEANFLTEDARFRYFKDFSSVRDQYRMLLGKGNMLLARINKIKTDKAEGIEKRIYTLKDRIESLKESTSNINEGRLVRKNLSKAEFLLTQAGFLLKNEDYDGAEANLKKATDLSKESTRIANSILSRYADKNQIAKWRGLVDVTIRESKNRRIVVFIVSKIDQSLMVYKNGKKLNSYDVGLGRNGLKDKLYAGDGGTPEGRYFIVKKNAGSRYYKALLFNYPNEEDRLRFAQAKKRGLIPARTGIGSLLEIHGGGSDGMTKGCISLENKDMDKIYALASEGTPLTIVGSTNGDNEILSYID